MKPVLIFGAGQIAQVFACYLEENGEKLASFVVDAAHMPDERPMGENVVPVEALSPRCFPPNQCDFVIGMSFKGLNKPRAEKYQAMLAAGYKTRPFLDNRAHVDCSAEIGQGTFIMEANVIQPFVEIGENCVLWSANHCGHHSKIGNHVWISSGVTISGAVEIGDRCFIGSGATIADNVRIGEDCVIGAGALILSDCEPGGVYSPGSTERSRVPSNRLRSI